MATRRQFLQAGVAAGAGLALAGTRFVFPNLAWAYYQSPGTPMPGSHWPGMAKYATTLRGVGPGGIPVAASDGIARTGAIHYSLDISEFTDQLHTALNPTTLWGYNPSLARGGGSQPQRHLGGIIVARKGTPVQLTFTNRLPPIHTLPVDVSTPALGGFEDAFARFGGSGHNAITTHLHGGFVPWVSDGGPYSWFTPVASQAPATWARS